MATILAFSNWICWIFNNVLYQLIAPTLDFCERYRVYVQTKNYDGRTACTKTFFRFVKVMKREGHSKKNGGRLSAITKLRVLAKKRKHFVYTVETVYWHTPYLIRLRSGKIYQQSRSDVMFTQTNYNHWLNCLEPLGKG